MRNLLTSLVLTAGLAAGFGMSAAQAQLLEPSTTQAPNPLTDATVKPGKMILFDLEARFAKDVLERFPGESNSTKRADILTYLRSCRISPAPLPK